MNENFVFRVLNLFCKEDSHDILFWRVDDGEIRFFVNCNDIFDWASADLEEITPENIIELEKAVADVKAMGSNETYEAFYLFCARMRKRRPQGAAYPSDRKLWPLFDAVGPERSLGLGNPKQPGQL